MKGGEAGQTDWDRLEDTPLPEHFADFAALSAAVAKRYPYVRHFLVWNEFKGFFDDELKRWDAKGYTDVVEPSSAYGRWGVCVKSSAASPNYHSVLLLWPERPGGGEVDFMEIADPTRQSVDAFVHYGSDQQVAGHIRIDATQWHSWAVEWTPQRIATFVDGAQWWETTNAAHIPTGLMRMCMQLDDFGGDISQGGQQIVDWARQYPLAET